MKKLEPFKFFCLQNFPFIEEDFDALTNYELMCKIVEYLNKNIDKTNELGLQVENLQNWFNNLDVQDEIDNKLDEMVLDGTLQEIIGDYFNVNKMIVFGDSWSSDTRPQNVWVQNVTDTLHLSTTNYAVSGAGFVNPGNNLISSQVTRFLTSDIDKLKVKYIVFFGGINDLRQSTTINQLVDAIVTEVNRVKNVCTNAKIVYISNTQYPYVMEESFYWQQVHSYLSTSAKIVTYNLDGQFGHELYENNWFHLDVYGQGWLSRNIMAVLTGGEIFQFRDVKECEDEYIKMRVATTRIKNMIFIYLKFKIKQSFESHTLTFPNDFTNIPWANSTEVTGMTGDNVISLSYALRTRHLVVAGSSTLPTKSFETSIIMPIVENVEL